MKKEEEPLKEPTTSILAGKGIDYSENRVLKAPKKKKVKIKLKPNLHVPDKMKKYLKEKQEELKGARLSYEGKDILIESKEETIKDIVSPQIKKVKKTITDFIKNMSDLGRR